MVPRVLRTFNKDAADKEDPQTFCISKSYKTTEYIQHTQSTKDARNVQIVAMCAYQPRRQILYVKLSNRFAKSPVPDSDNETSRGNCEADDNRYM